MEDLSIIENNLKELFVDYIDEMFKNIIDNKNYDLKNKIIEDINLIDLKKKEIIRYFDKTECIMKNMIKNIDSSDINNVEKVVLKI